MNPKSGGKRGGGRKIGLEMAASLREELKENEVRVPHPPLGCEEGAKPEQVHLESTQ